ncbi:LysR family transcriptional regulator [Xenophilus sp. AP218F]|nr:LysR family transcriptional regulator [Xenophilus sp. AP218F]
MTNRLPPLNALRVFEVAAHHLSFTKAANELFVTNAAVSHQIKLLENYLDLKLFERRNNQLFLTDAGKHYLPRVREAFRALQQATAMLQHGKSATLRVAAPTVLATKWLVPRLYRFLNLYPNIRIEVSSAAAQDYPDFDVAIDDKRPGNEDLMVEHFASTRFFPVCSPAMGEPVRSLADLARLPLLHVSHSPHMAHHPSWQQWLAEAGAGEMELSPSQEVDDAMQALQAAIDGQGVALGQSLLVEYDIAAGRLVKPLEMEVSLRLYYYLIFPTRSEDNSAFTAFRNWLKSETSAA